MSVKKTFCGHGGTVTFEVEHEHDVSVSDSSMGGLDGFSLDELELSEVDISAEKMVEEVKELNGSESNTVKFTEKGTLMYGMD